MLIGRKDKIKPIINNLGEGYSLDGIEITNAAITNNLERYIYYLKGFIEMDI